MKPDETDTKTEAAGEAYAALWEMKEAADALWEKVRAARCALLKAQRPTDGGGKDTALNIVTGLGAEGGKLEGLLDLTGDACDLYADAIDGAKQ